MRIHSGWPADEDAMGVDAIEAVVAVALALALIGLALAQLLIRR